ncbi:MAG: hypothetical protein LJE59_06360 [Chromatiaceae bacterium]|nr:hypothetical protein [Chromatiaceae bacterium]
MQSFDVYFLGELLPDVDPAAARREVARLFKIQEDAADRLFSGKPLRVKQALDADGASRYRAAFRDIGALVRIVPTGSPPPVAQTAAAAAAAPSPAGSGPRTPPAASDGITLAEPGAILDDTRPPPAATFDTSALQALPANSGSLEDCHVEKPHRPIPDISHLKLVDD